MFLKILNGIFLIAFLLSAAVQYNDPDMLPWVAVYAAAALLCILQQLNRVPIILPAALLSVALLWIALLLPAVMNGVPWADIFDSLSMKTKSVEEAREIGGLLLVAIWSSVILTVCWRSRKS